MHKIIYSIFFFSVLFFFSPYNVFAQKNKLGLDPAKAISQYQIDFWKKHEGLPQNSVFSVLQSSEGYIWVATYEGLGRFDGVNFEVFNIANVPEMRTSSYWEIFEDKSKTLWLASNGGGLTSLKNGKFKTYTVDEGLADNVVNTIEEDKDGGLWLGTRNGLSLYKDDSFKNFTKTQGLISNQITALHTDSKNRLWIGTNVGLNLYENGQFKNLTREILFVNKSITSIVEDENGMIWIGTLSGLINYNPNTKKYTSYTTENGLPDNYVTKLFTDSNGSLWVGTQSGGLARFSNNTFTTLTIKEGLTANSVTALYEDREGSLWIGLNRGGLNRLHDGKFVNYTTTEGLTDKLVNCIYEDKKGGLWIGTANGGVSYFKDGLFTNYTKKGGLTNHYIRSITEDNDGNTWIATYGGGVDKLKNGEITNFTIDEGLASNITRVVYKAKNGAIWIGTKEGLNKYENGKFSTYTTEQGLSTNSIICILEDKKGRLWIGTDGGGLNVLLNNGKIIHYNNKKGLANDLVFCIYEDQDGTIWVGTKGGLSAIKDEKVKSIYAKDGLSNPAVHSFIEDNEGNVWMTCNVGIYSTRKKQLDDFITGKADGIQCKMYDEDDGLKSADCAASSQPSICKDRNGFIWFPTTEGIAMIDPKNIKTNPLKPNVVIKKLVADNIQYDLSEEVLYFKAGTSKFEIDYAGLSFIAPGKVHFKYKLEGFDEDWIFVAQERDVYYTNLPPGYYTFRVIASNNDGVWNEEGAEIKFYIAPFFYQTYWFYILVTFLFIVFSVGFYYWRVRNLRMSQMILERGIEERTQKIKQQYEEINQQAEELATLDKIVRVINQEVKLENLLQALLEQGLELYQQAEKGMFLMFQKKKDTFKVAASLHYDVEEISKNEFRNEEIMEYLRSGTMVEADFYKLFPIEKNTFLMEGYYPKSSLVMFINVDSDDEIEGILILDNFTKNQTLQFDDFEKLRRFKEHAVSAFAKTHSLQEIELKNTEIENSFRKMADSMRYAKRIQEAIFVSQDEIINQFKDAFIFYRPKDIVSGDFYWFTETLPEPLYAIEDTIEGKQSVFKGFSESKKILAAIDCTGHGVPGALMTVVGNDLLEMIIKEKQVHKPSSILRQMDMGVKTYLKQEDGVQANDGMDMTVLVIDELEETIEFAGAKNPLFYIRNGELLEIKGSKYPIGGIQIKNKTFESHKIDYKTDDIFYLFSDGLQDQFGGEEDRKYTPKRFKEFLLKIYHLPLQEQKTLLELEFDRWKKESKQTDDVLVIGIKL